MNDSDRCLIAVLLQRCTMLNHTHQPTHQPTQHLCNRFSLTVKDPQPRPCPVRLPRPPAAVVVSLQLCLVSDAARFVHDAY